MAGPAQTPLVCPILVGRADYLDSAQRLLLRARGGKGQTLLLAGEAGIGKSRLVREIAGFAEARGMQVISGHSFELDYTLPFGPLLDALRGVLAVYPVATLARDLGPQASLLALLARLLPELAELEAVAGASIPVRPLEPEQEKRQLFDALEQCLLRLAARKPLLLVIEDIHWSDDSSLEFLLYFARHLAAQPVALALTYRSDEVAPSLAHFLASLDRERLATELPLRPLALEDEGAMLTAIFALERPVRPDFLAALYDLTEGNPFFLEEVLHTLVAAGELDAESDTWPTDTPHIPRTVQDTVRRRTERLSPGAHDALTYAAVIGQRFDFALLVRLTAQGEPALLRHLKELVAAHLIVEHSEEQFAFRHALTRAAVYRELLALERRTLHRAVADALETLHADAPDEYLADLAYHYAEGAVWEKALTYARRVGERAQELHSPRAAIKHYTSALDAASHLRLPEPADVRQARAHAYETLGDFARAREDYETALRLARETGDVLLEWSALLELGQLWAGRDYARTGDYARLALELARTLDRPAMLARSLNRFANWHVNVDVPAEGLRYHREALALFEALHDPDGEAETLDLLGMASLLSGDMLQADSYYRRALALYRELGQRRGLSATLAGLTLRGATVQTEMMVLPDVTLGETIANGEEAAQVAREIDWRAGEAFPLWLLALQYAARGDFARAFPAAEASLRIADEIEHRQWSVAARYALSTLYLALLAYPQAQTLLEEALPRAVEIGSAHWRGYTAGTLAVVHIGQGHLAAAEAILDEHLPRQTPCASLGQRIAWCARVELLLARGEHDHALSLLDALTAQTPNATPERLPIRFGLYRGRALAALGRGREAETHLRAALAAAEFHGARYPAWQLLTALAALYATHPNCTGEAARTRAAAHDLARAIAATIPDPALREAFPRAAGIANIAESAAAPEAAPTTTTARPTANRQPPSKLTARERQVAALVAEGKSNRAIADALVVSERTVESHITNILGKLGFTSRAQIAAWLAAQR